jgi:hypothetical protein
MENHDYPKILENFLTHEMCDYMINISHNKFQHSTIGTDNNKSLNKKIRDSYTCVLDTFLDNKSKYISQKCADITNKTIYHIENLHVVKYEDGGFYSPHYDLCRMKNDRQYTIIIALNDDYEGGETIFPNLKIKYKLKKGDALFFHNYDVDMKPNELSYHGGGIVKNGEKYICNMWIYEHPFYHSIEDVSPKLFKNFISKKTCEYLINNFSNSKKFKISNREKYLKFLNYDDNIALKIANKCSALVNKTYDYCECIEIYKCLKNQYTESCEPHIINVDNPRKFGIVIALNDNYENGEFTFPVLGKTSKLQSGTAIFFTENESSRIVQQNITSGESYYCVIWICEKSCIV